jgi:light-independent protochlorophyllide reductase subunit B
MGWEGANVIFDDWVHPLMMGLEEHLIDMFKHDFEFVDGHQSHLGHTATKGPENKEDQQTRSNINIQKKGNVIWTDSGRAELTKVPFFVRGKVKSNTEKYALSKGLPEISDETLYDAKAYFG